MSGNHGYPERFSRLLESLYASLSLAGYPACFISTTHSSRVVPSLRGWPPITSTRIGIISLGLCSLCGILGAVAAVLMQRSGEDIAIVATLTGTAIGSLAGFLNSVWQR